MDIIRHCWQSAMLDAHPILQNFLDRFECELISALGDGRQNLFFTSKKIYPSSSLSRFQMIKNRAG
jgi:hypothetical protein